MPDDTTLMCPIHNLDISWDCILCKKAYRKRYYKANKEEINNRNNKNYKNNRHKVLARQKRYIEEYKEVRRETKRKYENQRRINNPQYRFRINFTNAINRVLRKQGSGKNNISSFKIVSYTEEELLTHIETQFEWWMNWNNWGKYNSKTWNDSDPQTWTWQLDHIEPLENFNIKNINDEEFRKAWTLSNLRPLSAKQNVLDGTRRTRHKKTK